MNGNIENLRNLLWTWGTVDKECAELMNDLKIAAEMLADARDIGITSKMDGMPHGTSISDPTYNEVIKIRKLEDSFKETYEATDREFQKLQRLKRVMNEHISRLSPIQRDVIRMRYREGHTMPYIAISTHYSLSMIYHIESEALEKIVKNYKFDDV